MAAIFNKFYLHISLELTPLKCSEKIMNKTCIPLGKVVIKFGKGWWNLSYTIKTAFVIYF